MRKKRKRYKNVTKYPNVPSVLPGERRYTRETQNTQRIKHMRSTGRKSGLTITSNAQHIEHPTIHATTKALT